MQKQEDLTIVSKQTLEEILVSLEYLQTIIKTDLEPISEEFKHAKQIRVSLNTLTSTMKNFNDDVAKKIRFGSVEEILTVLNEIEKKVERLGESLTKKYQQVLDKHQIELFKIIEGNVQTSIKFENKLSSMMANRVKSLDITKLERKIEAEIKKRLNHFPFEEMESLRRVLKMEQHLKEQEKIYEDCILTIQEQNIQMREIAEENKEHIGILQYKYIVTSFGLGIIVGYTDLFSFVSGLG